MGQWLLSEIGCRMYSTMVKSIYNGIWYKSIHQIKISDNLDIGDLGSGWSN